MVFIDIKSIHQVKQNMKFIKIKCTFFSLPSQTRRWLRLKPTVMVVDKTTKETTFVRNWGIPKTQWVWASTKRKIGVYWNKVVHFLSVQMLDTVQRKIDFIVGNIEGFWKLVTFEPFGIRCSSSSMLFIHTLGALYSICSPLHLIILHPGAFK